MIQQISPKVQISLEVSGTKNSPALVLLHAFPLSSAMWQEQLQHFSPRYQVIAPDVRGIGDSTPFSDQPSIEQMARDLVALLDSLSIDTAIVGGCSMGGYVALEFARQFPERLSGLILCDTRPDADSEDAKKARDEMKAFVLAHNGSAVADKMLPKLLCDETRENSPAIVQKVKALAVPISGQVAAQLVQALRDRRDSTPVLNSIKVPTLVIGGGHDVPSPVEIMAQMASHIPGAKHAVIERAAHLSSLEQSETWNREVEFWLDANGL